MCTKNVFVYTQGETNYWRRPHHTSTLWIQLFYSSTAIYLVFVVQRKYGAWVSKAKVTVTGSAAYFKWNDSIIQWIWFEFLMNINARSLPLRASCERAISSKQRRAIDTPPTHYTQSILITFGSRSRFFPSLSFLILLSLLLFIGFVLFRFGFCVLNEITLWIYYVYYWIETYPSMFYCHLRQPIIYLVFWPIQSWAMIVWQYKSYTIDIDCCCCWCCWWWWRRWWWFLSLRASTMLSM